MFYQQIDPDQLARIVPMLPELGAQMFVRLTNTAAYTLLAGLGHLLVKLFIRRGINKLRNRQNVRAKALTPRLLTVRSILENAAGVVIWGVVFVIVLSEWGVNIAPIITGAGVIGLAVGFGSQTLVRDVVSGFFILLENQYNVGDRVEVVGVKGKVTDVNLRTTILQADDASVHIIPNSQITKVTTNLPEEEPVEEEVKETSKKEKKGKGKE